MREIVLIIHNVRSTYNVGSLLRTADGLGIAAVFLTGYTPYPRALDDQRLPYLADKIDTKIHKTALGAEQSVTWQHSDSFQPVLHTLRAKGFAIVALEQHERAISLLTFQPTNKIALIVGREVEGIEVDILAACDSIVEIPMRGQKESFNVASAAAMALFRLACW